MEKTKYVFIILVYRNTEDLTECLDSIERHVKSFRAIVVNAYYNDETEKQAKKIALSHNCEYLNIDNKGYSYGNNRGVDLANKLFDYEYVVISNPDIVVEEFNDQFLNQHNYDIIAPRIVAARGREQNPMGIKKHNICQYLQYIGFKRRNNILVYLGIFISKIRNSIDKFAIMKGNKHLYQIYEAHGSFVIISKKAEKLLHPIYDEKMFLFAEEGVLASKAEKKELKTCYYDGIYIKHKEDGSMKLGNIVVNEELRKANIYCYEHYK